MNILEPLSPLLGAAITAPFQFKALGEAKKAREQAMALALRQLKEAKETQERLREERKRALAQRREELLASPYRVTPIEEAKIRRGVRESFARRGFLPESAAQEVEVVEKARAEREREIQQLLNELTKEELGI